jgi:hypothetical protein
MSARISIEECAELRARLIAMRDDLADHAACMTAEGKT